jgi:hypothetical protein
MFHFQAFRKSYRSTSRTGEPPPETTSTITGFPGQSYFRATRSLTDSIESSPDINFIVRLFP